MTYISTAENMAIMAAVMDALRDIPVGEILPRSRLENLLSGKPHLLRRARELVEREQGCILATVIREGVKKIDPTKADTVGAQARQRAHRGLITAKSRIIAVVRSQEGELNAQDKLRLTSELNKLGLAAEFCG